MAKGHKTIDKVAPALSREAILRFVAENPHRATKRDIARVFDVVGDDRRILKALLHELQTEGVIERSHRQIKLPGQLPATLVMTVTGRDRDGELFAEPLEWDEDTLPPKVVILLSKARGRAADPVPGQGDRILARSADLPRGYEGAAKFACRIIKILEKRPPQVLGVFRANPYGGRVQPVSRRQNSEVVIQSEDVNGAEDGDLVTVEIRRTNRQGLPLGRVKDRLGSMKSEKAISMIAIISNDIPHVFPAEVMEEAAAARPATLDGREDWRDLPLVTIDPPDAKDHDDAIHAMPDPDPANPGGVIATVAIADVAAYVRPGTPLDREALTRGNSVYFPDRVVPMLPERISNHLCSLRELEDRPALAVRMIFDAHGHKKRHSFHRVMMRSAARLSYIQAQAAIDGFPDEKSKPLLDPILKPLWDAYSILWRGRLSREPLDLDLPERKILLKPDGTVDRVVTPERLDAHKLVEEFMIQANVAAAETLETKRTPFVYRIHDEPSLTKLEGLRDFLGSMDINLARQGALRPSLFNTILTRVKTSENQHLVNEMVLRSQSQAEYSPTNIGHFGLNLRRYAHFTSPIRRYSDLIVHRALVSALDLGPDGLPKGIEDRLERIASDISSCERRAMTAERETIDRLIAEWLSDQVGEEFEGRIAGVTKAGLFVKLAESGADGFVPAATLGKDYYAYDEARMCLVGDRSGETFRLGDIVEVKLVEVAPLAGALRFEMLSHGARGKPLKGASRRGRLRDAKDEKRARRRR